MIPKTKFRNETGAVQYSVGKIVLVTFAPALLLLAMGVAVRPLAELPNGVAIGVYLVLESIILGAFIVFFAKREGQTKFREAIPYQAKVNPLVFLSVLVVVTACAIYFRDFYRWKPLMDVTMQIRSALAFWPPEFLALPGFSFTDPNVSKSTQLSLYIFGVLSLGSASVMQSLYFQGFLLPRMEAWGWAAPVANTLLFAMFHLHSPAFWHLFFLYIIAWGIAAFALRNVLIVVISHIIFNVYALAPPIYELMTG